MHRGDYPILLFDDESTITSTFSRQRPTRRVSFYRNSRILHSSTHLRYVLVIAHRFFRLFSSLICVRDSPSIDKRREKYGRDIRRCCHGGCSAQEGPIWPRNRYARQDRSPIDIAGSIRTPEIHSSTVVLPDHRRLRSELRR